MIYETMKKEYLNDVEKLQQEWASEDITYGVVAGTPQQIAEAMTPYCFVLKDEQKIVGYLLAELRRENEFCIFPDGASFIEVNDLFITKDYRSRGLGKMLLHHCEEEARKNGIEYVLLASATKDAGAIRNFYTSNDYTIWTTQFFKNLD